MRRRTLLEDKKGSIDEFFELPNGSNATAMSVVFANKNAKKLEIVEDGKWNTSSYPASTYTPIGIVVIPGDHGVLKAGDGLTNQCGVMSIVPMNYSTPEKGGTSEQYIYWGGYGNDISGKADKLGRYDSVSDGLTNYDVVNYVGSKGNVNSTVQGTTSQYVHLPSDMFLVANPYDTKAGYASRDSDYYAPSPYNNDGSYNSVYGQTTSPASEANALSDFKGIVNTKILTDLATAQNNWKTSSTVTNNSGSGYYPAACCCARFKTTGTKAFVNCTTEELRNGTGFWYMPACGELGYFIVRLSAIDDTIGKLKTAYNVGVQLDTFGSPYLSSTEYNSNKARDLGPEVGLVRNVDKNSSYHVRAFMRL